VTNAGEHKVRWIDAEARSVNPCAWCQHVEFIHAIAGLCLFSECTCPFFVPGPSKAVEAWGDAQ
jgi:hypothetical protein